jgi:hypothetical protein
LRPKGSQESEILVQLPFEPKGSIVIAVLFGPHICE